MSSLDLRRRGNVSCRSSIFWKHFKVAEAGSQDASKDNIPVITYKNDTLAVGIKRKKADLEAMVRGLQTLGILIFPQETQKPETMTNGRTQ